MEQRASAVSPTVLLVEDDLAVRRSLELTFELAGLAMQSFKSGEALLGRELPTGPLCLIADERLPGASGFETVQRLRAQRPDAWSILITTHPSPALRRAAAACGTPILEKPLDGDVLVASIRAQFATAN